MSSTEKVWLKSLAYPSGEEGGKFLVQMIYTCLFATHVDEGGRGSTPCGRYPQGLAHMTVGLRLIYSYV
jgi:hypothetical protein